ncbi:restriction endonuclease (plasmid) [Rhodococcus pyridinivorans]|uniref:Restriction endonuclease n=1 Tax=Rhodococcus qingshengii TaxID=334542 RepID=A0AAW6LUX5_RHOSG|nr:MULTISPECIES: restriction endonuclease [Rhodococcus]MCT7294211.1 restriction endonuclease [Rhodococcus sp. PAE-6]MDE8648942.1 restriction endonuclease [Rhodococcus qingshengii]QXU56391.1 restriction endonuclease [Rhodococcus sp. LW-XY12]UQB75761.1 restriction endonuclease [Rhodococcus ruber]UVT27654.1 restriction endonuclease [Rhodococcus pyridinivorans]
MEELWLCGYCGGPLVLGLSARCRLCLREVKGLKGEVRWRDESAARYLDSRGPGLGQWYLANKARIKAQARTKPTAFGDPKYRPVLSPDDAEHPFPFPFDLPSSQSDETDQPSPTVDADAPPPRVRLRGRPLLTWEDAEDFAEDWMRKNGYPDARKTKAGPDGGIDVTSARAVAQVKFFSSKIALHEIQRLSGIAHAEGKDAIFFSRTGYTKKAKEWGDRHGVRCLTFQPRQRR